MNTTCVDLRRDFSFALVDENSERLASTSGPQELGPHCAEHELREHGLRMAVVLRQLHTGTWFAAARLGV